MLEPLEMSLGCFSCPHVQITHSFCLPLFLLDFFFLIWANFLQIVLIDPSSPHFPQKGALGPVRLGWFLPWSGVCLSHSRPPPLPWAAQAGFAGLAWGACRHVSTSSSSLMGSEFSTHPPSELCSSPLKSRKAASQRRALTELSASFSKKWSFHS